MFSRVGPARYKAPSSKYEECDIETNNHNTAGNKGIRNHKRTNPHAARERPPKAEGVVGHAGRAWTPAPHRPGRAGAPEPQPQPPLPLPGGRRAEKALAVPGRGSRAGCSPRVEAAALGPGAAHPKGARPPRLSGRRPRFLQRRER